MSEDRTAYAADMDGDADAARFTKPEGVNPADTYCRTCAWCSFKHMTEAAAHLERALAIFDRGTRYRDFIEQKSAYDRAVEFALDAVSARPVTEMFRALVLADEFQGDPGKYSAMAAMAVGRMGAATRELADVFGPDIRNSLADYLARGSFESRAVLRGRLTGCVIDRVVAVSGDWDRSVAPSPAEAALPAVEAAMGYAHWLEAVREFPTDLMNIPDRLLSAWDGMWCPSAIRLVRRALLECADDLARGACIFPAAVVCRPVRRNGTETEGGIPCETARQS